MKFNIPAEHKNASGVYIIRNSVNSKVYVGSAANFAERYRHHKSSIKRGNHHSAKVQNLAKKYGCCVFSFEILELVSGDKKQILEAEQRWIDTLGAATEKGLNILPTVGYGVGPVPKYSFVCARCQAAFTSQRPHRKFCSNKCRGEAWGATQPGVNHSPDIVAKMVSTRLKRGNYKMSDNALQKMRQKLQSPEMRARISRKLMGRPSTRKKSQAVQRVCPTCGAAFEVKFECVKKQFCKRQCYRTTDKTRQAIASTQKTVAASRPPEYYQKCVATRHRNKESHNKP